MVTEVWAYRDMTLCGLDLAGFEVEARDGPLGKVERTVTDATGGYLVVDAGSLAPLGGRVLIPAGVVDDVDLDSERLFVRLTRDEIRRAPEYDWQVPLGQQEREQFATYYAGRRAGSAPREAARGRGRLEAVRTAPRRERRSTPRSEKTKEQLYAEAKKLGIEGRSKMSKAQLARAIEKHGGRPSASRSSAKANPVEVQKFLEGVGYPTGRSDLVAEARKQGASGEVRKTLERLPDRRFKTPAEVSKAIGKLSR